MTGVKHIQADTNEWSMSVWLYENGTLEVKIRPADSQDPVLRLSAQSIGPSRSVKTDIRDLTLLPGEVVMLAQDLAVALRLPDWAEMRGPEVVSLLNEIALSLEMSPLSFVGLYDVETSEEKHDV